MCDMRRVLRALGSLWHALTRLPHYKLLAVGFSLGVWLYVQSEEVVQDRVRADVEWVTPVALMPTEALPSSVTITVEGSLSAVRRAKRSQLTVLADLSEATVGEATLDFGTLEISGLPTSVTPISTSPSSIRFTLDEAAERKVAVRSVTVGDPAEGYAVMGVELIPPVVELRGPRQAVSHLVEIDTLPIDVTGMDEDTELVTQLDLPRQVRPVGDSSLHARVDVEMVLGSRVFKAVPVVFLEPGWRADPEVLTVRLRGPAQTLRSIPGDRVLVVGHLPVQPGVDVLDLSYGAREGPRLDLVLPAAQDAGLLADLVPDRVEVRRR